MASITGAFATVYSGSCGDNLTYTLDTSTGVLKIEGTGAMSDYSRNYTNNGTYVTNAPWGSHYKIFNSVNVSKGVTSIGDYAFYGCSYLTSIIIPEGVTSIGQEAFYSCSYLPFVTLPSSVTSIGDNAFYECTRLTSVTLSEGVASIGSSAFRGCSSLTSITIPSSVTSMGNHAFAYCSSMASVSIPNSVTSIGDYAFWNCSSLTSITIPESVTSIGSSAFHGTPWYTNQSDGVIYAGLVAYKYKGTMPGNTSAVLKDGTKGIACSAFSNCSSLTSITIPSSVTSIGSSAFSYCI